MTAAYTLGCAIRHGFALGLCNQPYTGLHRGLRDALGGGLYFTLDSVMRSSARDGIDLGLHNGLHKGLVTTLKSKRGTGHEYKS